ncbi:VWA-like domain-containing protein [bacterium]|nr:VWA-like domain-containing protein [bacterium]MDA7645370.1 VWA-like domain-containing protein [bacterium]
MSVDDASFRIQTCLVRLRARHPFFGALALFVEHCLDEQIPTAATDGKRVRFNPSFACEITAPELDGVMVHELLHASLRHCTRRAHRDAELWNVAADIVVNGMIREVAGLELPFEPIEDDDLKDLEVEEVYERLPRQPDTFQLDGQWVDIETPSDGAADIAQEDQSQEDYWRSAMSRVRLLVGPECIGDLPSGLARHVAETLEPSLDWRTLLWRFLARTPIDFQGYDRRFIGRGLYLDDLQGETLKARLCIDTSGSISDEDLGQFLAELRSILAAYPQIDLLLYYADTDLHGPFKLADENALKPLGGGGTDFRPFFKEMESADHVAAVLIYFTDGLGSFPSIPPDQETIWVISSKRCLPLSLPFGESCLLASNAFNLTD